MCVETKKVKSKKVKVYHCNRAVPVSLLCPRRSHFRVIRPVLFKIGIHLNFFYLKLEIHLELVQLIRQEKKIFK